MSTESVMKHFIAVGTTINRGEDLAVKGRVCVHEIVEVVPDASTNIFARASGLGERLVGGGFLDVAVYVTSLQTAKNLPVIGSAMKSVWLQVSSQEDPYTPVILGRTRTTPASQEPNCSSPMVAHL
ncbi:hypothetical protein LXA43DRAFT_1096357 [Ganoderma leucocontextum]|nr:hypothetical protein LXA43DRAFT_1096357 [Ganoderma leucocontextum]